MQDHRTASNSALVQELADTRAELRSALSIGDTLQARVDAAIAIVELLPPTQLKTSLLAALKGAQ